MVTYFPLSFCYLEAPEQLDLFSSYHGYKSHVMGLSLKYISVSKRALQNLKHIAHTTTSDSKYTTIFSVSTCTFNMGANSAFSIYLL